MYGWTTFAKQRSNRIPPPEQLTVAAQSIHLPLPTEMILIIPSRPIAFNRDSRFFSPSAVVSSQGSTLAELKTGRETSTFPDAVRMMTVCWRVLAFPADSSATPHHRFQNPNLVRPFPVLLEACWHPSTAHRDVPAGSP
jgi:hypothetical protein